MKLSNSVKWLLALTLAGWPGGRARAQSIMPPVAAATQTEVNAGTAPRKYVAPLTLAGWTAASATNLARLNSNNIFTGSSNRFVGVVNVTSNVNVGGAISGNASGVSNAVDVVSGVGVTVTTNTAGRTFTLSSALTNNTDLPGVSVGAGVGTNLTTLPTLAGDNIFTGASNRFTGAVNFAAALWATNLSGPSGGSLSLGTGGTPFMLVNDIGIGTYNGTAFYGNGSGLTNLPVSAITNASEYFDPRQYDAVNGYTNAYLVVSNDLVIQGIGWTGVDVPAAGVGYAWLRFHTNTFNHGFKSDGLTLDVYAGTHYTTAPIWRWGYAAGTRNSSEVGLDVTGTLVVTSDAILGAGSTNIISDSGSSLNGVGFTNGGSTFTSLTTTTLIITTNWDGTLATNLTGASVTGTVPDATRAVYVTTSPLSNSITGNATSATGSEYATNLTDAGNILAGTVPEARSHHTLTNLNTYGTLGLDGGAGYRYIGSENTTNTYIPVQQGKLILEPAYGLDVLGNVSFTNNTAASQGAAFGPTSAELFYGSAKTLYVSNAAVYLGTDVPLYGTSTNKGVKPYISAPGNENFFAGPDTGNLAITGPTGGVSGNRNIGLGYGVLQALTTGHRNIGIGFSVLSSLTDGNYNTIIGEAAMDSATSATHNVGLGHHVMRLATDAALNTAVGDYALEYNTSGRQNTAIGYGVLQRTQGTNNVAVGYESQKANTNGLGNVSVGSGTLNSGTDLTYCTAVGNNALYSAVDSAGNVAVGAGAIQEATGNGNAGIGYLAGGGLTTGDFNTFLGYGGAGGITSGNRNLILGYNPAALSGAQSDRLNIGNLLFGTIANGTGVSTGNFGVSIVSPTSTLHATNAGQQAVVFQVDTSAGAGGLAVLSNSVVTMTNATAEYQGAVFGPNYFNLAYGSASTLSGTNGNVGIGTTGPGAKLHAVDTSRAWQIRADGGSGQGGGIEFYNSIAGATRRNWGLATEVYAAGDLSLSVSSSAGGSPAGGGTSVMEFLSNGNVGIGMTGPGVTLDVLGAHVSATGLARFKGSGNFGFMSLDTSGTQASSQAGFLLKLGGVKVGQVAAEQTNKVAIYNNVYSDATPMMVLTSTGNVGINLASPTATLHATNAANQAVVLQVDTSSGASSFFVSSNGVASGNGSGLTNLSASNLAAGTVPDARLASNVQRTNDSITANRLTTDGVDTWFWFNNSGGFDLTSDGGVLTNLTGASVTGTVPDSTRAVYVTTSPLSNSISGNATSATLASYVSGDLTNNTATATVASYVSGTLSNSISGNADTSTLASYVSGILTNTVALASNIQAGATLNAANGAALTNLAVLGSQITLSGFDNAFLWNNSGGIDLTFDGGGLTNLTGANVVGTVPDATRSVYVTTGSLTNFVILAALDSIPTNSIPTSTAAATNWVHLNWTNTGPVYVATNLAAAGSFLLRVPTTTLSTWP